MTIVTGGAGRFGFNKFTGLRRKATSDDVEKVVEKRTVATPSAAAVIAGARPAQSTPGSRYCRGRSFGNGRPGAAESGAEKAQALRDRRRHRPCISAFGVSRPRPWVFTA